MESIIILSKDSHSNTSLIKLDAAGHLINVTNTGIKYQPGFIYNLTNAAQLYQQYRNRPQQFDFIVRLTNLYDKADFTYTKFIVDTTQFTSGKHHFAVRIDGKQGNITLFIDGTAVSNQAMDEAQYVHVPIFNNSVSFGSTQFSRGVTLSQYLQQSKRFYMSGMSLQNVFVYNEALRDDDIKLLCLVGNTIDDLRFHLPCGQRNNIDKIKQMFLWGSPIMKSSNIKILLKNANVMSAAVRDTLKQQIQLELVDILPVSTNVLDIQFVDFD